MAHEMTKAMLRGFTNEQLVEMAAFIKAEQDHRERARKRKTTVKALTR